MAAKLPESLKKIENYKATNPHYSDLLDILAEILILREQYRKNMVEPIFSVDEKLISGKMKGGLPLIDMAFRNYDLTRPKEYFYSLIDIAQRRMPEEGEKIMEVIQDKDFDWEKMIRSSFCPNPEEPIEWETKDGETDDQHLDLIDLFIEESLRPELEYIAEKYGAAVEKTGWTEGYCPICGKEPKIGEIRKVKTADGICFVISADTNGTSAGSNAPFAAMRSSIHLPISPWRARKDIGWMFAISAAAI